MHDLAATQGLALLGPHCELLCADWAGTGSFRIYQVDCLACINCMPVVFLAGQRPRLGGDLR